MSTHSLKTFLNTCDYTWYTGLIKYANSEEDGLNGRMLVSDCITRCSFHQMPGLGQLKLNRGIPFEGIL